MKYSHIRRHRKWKIWKVVISKELDIETVESNVFQLLKTKNGIDANNGTVYISGN